MAANASMKAALVLSFEDKLSAGLGKLEKQLDTLKKLGKEQGLGKLETAFEDIQRTVGATRDLASELRNVQSAAKGAYADLRRVEGAYSNIARQRSFTRNDAAMLWGGMRPARGPREGAGGMSEMMAGVGGLVAGYGIMESSRSYASFEDLARRAGITKGLSGDALTADSRRLMALFNREALATGQSGTNIGEAYLDLAGMGIAPGEVERLLPIHSRIATAYNINPEVLSKATAALNQTLKISDADMGGALSAMATAAKEGRFKVEDFARFLPGITANLAGSGMTGRGAANTAFAAAEVVMKAAQDPGTGNADFGQLFNDIFGPSGQRNLALQSPRMSGVEKYILNKYHVHGIDMPKVLEDARVKGVDPLTAIVGGLKHNLKGLPPDVQREILGAYFHNDASRTAALALLQHSDDFVGIKKQLAGVGDATGDRDFQSRMQGAEVQMKLLDEELAQLNRRIGQGFSPGVKVAVTGLQDLNDAFDALNNTVPGLGDGVAAVGGGALGLSAALGAISLLMPSVGGRLTRMLLAPAKLLTSEFKLAADVLGIDMVAALGRANAAMLTFNSTTMVNPLFRTAAFVMWLFNDLKGRMPKPGDPDITGMPPDKVRTLFGAPEGGRSDQEDVEHHGPGLGTPSVSVPGAPGGVLGTILVGIDPTTGAPIITHMQGNGVNLAPAGASMPDPGRITGRP
jgi:TP901 family phage tail tape measure protein